MTDYLLIAGLLLFLVVCCACWLHDEHKKDLGLKTHAVVRVTAALSYTAALVFMVLITASMGDGALLNLGSTVPTSPR